MAKGVNKVILVGNLGNEPETRHLNDTKVTTFSVATSETFKGRDGNQHERTEWHRVAAWGRLAEICAEYLGKGSKVYVEGSLRTRSWDDNDGNKRYATEIVAREVVMLGGAQDGQRRGNNGQAVSTPPYGNDDIPF